MDWIPQPVFEEFLAELAMYRQHLDYVLVKLDGLDEAIKEEYERIEGNYNPEYHDAGDVWYQAAKNILGVDTMFSPHFQKVGAIGGYCIVVYHLFERFLEELCQLRGLYCSPLRQEGVEVSKMVAEQKGVQPCSDANGIQRPKRSLCSKG